MAPPPDKYKLYLQRKNNSINENIERVKYTDQQNKKRDIKIEEKQEVIKPKKEALNRIPILHNRVESNDSEVLFKKIREGFISVPRRKKLIYIDKIKPHFKKLEIIQQQKLLELMYNYM